MSARERGARSRVLKSLGMLAFVRVALACGGVDSGSDAASDTDDEPGPIEDGHAEDGGAQETHGDPLGSDAGDESRDASWPDANLTPRPLEPLVCEGPGARFGTSVYDYAWGPGQDFGQHDLKRVLGPPKGAGCCTGSLDVVSLGKGGYIVLAFEGNAIVDYPGPDFIVFENVFGRGNDLSRPTAELGTVAVSEDGVHWVEFPCTANQAPAGSCAGWHATFANPDSNEIDPTDPEVAGGDAFDLAEIGVSRARLVRITDRADLVSEGTVFDLDAIAIVHGACL